MTQCWLFSRPLIGSVITGILLVSLKKNLTIESWPDFTANRARFGRVLADWSDRDWTVLDFR